MSSNTPPPPPPPPHGNRPNSHLPPGNYDIFVIPPHSAGSGFLYLPSLKPNPNSFIAGFVCGAFLTALWHALFLPFLRNALIAFTSGGGLSLFILAIAAAAFFVNGRSRDSHRQPDIPPPAPGPGPSSTTRPTSPQFDATWTWENARQETKRRDDERRAAETKRSEQTRAREKEAQQRNAREKASSESHQRPRATHTSSVSDTSESSPSVSTAPTSNGPSHASSSCSSYTTSDPDKILLNGVHLLTDAHQTSQLLSRQGKITDGLILRITTEGVFIDDDVRQVAQREWDVKAWSIKLIETGCLASTRLLRLSLRGSGDLQQYVFVLPAEQGWKVDLGLQRLRKGPQVRAMGMSGLRDAEVKRLLVDLGWMR